MIRVVLFGLLLALLGPACTSDAPEPSATASPDTDALQDTLDQLIPTAPATPAYPDPDPFVGSYRNDPDVEGFVRQLEIDSAGAGSYRVRLTAVEVSGEFLCRHAAAFERIDTLVLQGRIEGSVVRIRAEGAALEVRPTDAQLRASPGLLCPGASIFGWSLPEWVYSEGLPDTLALPARDAWLADSVRLAIDKARAAAGQPGRRLRYETEVLTRGDYDGDGIWDYAALLRDPSGGRGLYVRRGATPPRRWERIADLTPRSGDSPTSYPATGLTTPRGGTLPATARAAGREQHTSGILLQYYDSTAVFFYLEQNRWRRIALTGRAE